MTKVSRVVLVSLMVLGASARIESQTTGHDGV